jgi:hypothetical protein
MIIFIFKTLSWIKMAVTFNAHAAIGKADSNVAIALLVEQDLRSLKDFGGLRSTKPTNTTNIT